MAIDIEKRKQPVNAGEVWQGFGSGDETGNTVQQDREPLFTGNKTVDTLLHNGVRYGSQTCVSAHHKSDSASITNSIIVSHLHRSEDAQVMVIDATNAFDVRALARVIQRKTPASLDKGTVFSLLERVKIVKTFDIQGAIESINNIRDGCCSGEVAYGHLVVVDRLSHTARILSKNSASKGQAQLDAFFRASRELSTDCGVCVVLSEEFIDNRGDSRDDDCVIRTNDRQPFFDATTAPSLDLHVHVHVVVERQPATQNTSQRLKRRVLEIAASRHDARSGRWTFCEASEMKM